MHEQVQAITYRLGLFGMHAACAHRAAQALAESLHPLEFLRLLLEDEVLARKDKAAKSLTTRARFRFRAELEDWDVTSDRGVSPQKIRELATLGFLASRENLLIIGKTGEGKTHLAIALGKRLCQEGHKTLFLPVSFLFEETSAARASGKYLEHIKTLTKTTALILDDFGLRNYTHEEAMVLLDILEERYQKGVVIVTSQVTPEGWLKLFDDPVVAEAIVDRLLHPSQKLILKGGASYRTKLRQETAKKTEGT